MVAQLVIGLVVLVLGMAVPVAVASLPRPAVLAVSSLVPVWLLAKHVPRLNYYLRLTLYLTGMGICSAWGVFISIVMALVGQSSNVQYVVARSFYYLTSPFTGLRFTVEGEDRLHRTTPAVYVGNHQTMIDILYLGRIFPKRCSVMAKKELKWTPLLGQFMSLSNSVFVNRSSRQDAFAVFAKAATTMKRKLLSIFIFAEGTRSASQTPTLLPFKKGAFHLAVTAQLPIVPIVCENYAAGYSSSRKRFDGGDFTIRVLPEISTKGYTSSSEDIAKLVQLTRDTMLENIVEMGKLREARETA